MDSLHCTQLLHIEGYEIATQGIAASDSQGQDDIDKESCTMVAAVAPMLTYPKHDTDMGIHWAMVGIANPSTTHDLVIRRGEPIATATRVTMLQG